ncbi:phosphatidate cytidylyltransferase [Fusobacterium varium]|uniref:phosphatidate cytidylyltransferase n=1 Tax=Fusobacterium varium TaxID=856 RepID=UPI003569CFA0
MLSRIMVAIVGIPLLIYILYHGGFPLLLFVNVIVGMGAYEFYNMAEMGGKKPHKAAGIIGALLIPNVLFFNELGTLSIDVTGLLAFFVIFLIGYRVLENKVENASVDIGETVLGALYISVLFSHVILISFLPNGGKWLLTAQIMVWVCDSFAYFTGMAIGRKIFNRGFSSISPKKSIEGSIGGTVFTIISLYLLEKYFNLLNNGELGMTNIVIIGIFISIIAQIGDLGESMFKREFKVKDSGSILKGHGGILDRFDSMLFVAPTVYYLLKFIVL